MAFVFFYHRYNANFGFSFKKLKVCISYEQDYRKGIFLIEGCKVSD